jgi:hypothetical protein
VLWKGCAGVKQRTGKRVGWVRFLCYFICIGCVYVYVCLFAACMHAYGREGETRHARLHLYVGVSRFFVFDDVGSMCLYANARVCKNNYVRVCVCVCVCCVCVNV